MDFVYQPITLRGRPPLTERDTDIVSLYTSGKTLEEIGIKYQLSRERIRQVLYKNGITGTSGGKKVRAKSKSLVDAERRVSVRTKKENTVSLFYGCTLREMIDLCHGLTPTNTSNRRAMAYQNQRRNAEARGISWNMTFPDWLKFWQESGHWLARGIGKKHYCMARLNDSGPYKLGNVKICRNEENASESFLIISATERWKRSREIEPNTALRAYLLRRGGLTWREISIKMKISVKYTANLISKGRKLYLAMSGGK